MMRMCWPGKESQFFRKTSSSLVVATDWGPDGNHAFTPREVAGQVRKMWQDVPQEKGRRTLLRGMQNAAVKEHKEIVLATLRRSQWWGVVWDKWGTPLRNDPSGAAGMPEFGSS